MLKHKIYFLTVLSAAFLLFGCDSKAPCVQDFERDYLGMQEGDYSILDFGLNYPETVEIDGIRDGKIYFQYLDAEPYFGKERYDFLEGKSVNAVGIYDIRTGELFASPFKEDDFEQDGVHDVLSSTKNHLIMDNDLGYFTAALAPHSFPEQYHIYSFTVDYRNATRKITHDYGEYGYSTPHHLPHGSDAFFIYFEDQWAHDAAVYRYDTRTDEVTKVIQEPEDIQFLTAMASDNDIWVYGTSRRNGRRRSLHFLYRYSLEGSLKGKYQLPEEIANDQYSSTNTFIPDTMMRFSGNIFYLEDFGHTNHYFLELKNNEFQLLPDLWIGLEPHTRVMPYIRMLPHNSDRTPSYFYFRAETQGLSIESGYYIPRYVIAEYNQKKQTTREILLPLHYGSSSPYVLYDYPYSDEKGNLLIRAEVGRSWDYPELPVSDYVKFYYIPRKTFEKYASAYR